MNIPVTLLDLGWGAADKIAGIEQIIGEVRRLCPQIIQAVNYHSNLLMRLARPFLPCSTILIGCVYVNYTPKQLFYERLSSRLCTAIVCNSPAIESQLRPFVPSLSLYRIANGIDLQRFAHNPDPTLRTRLAPQAHRILLFMGRVTHQKAPYLLIEAVGLLKRRNQLSARTLIWIVGEIETSQIIEDVTHGCELDGIVTCFPPTTQPEMFYHAADITVLPSLWEGLPNVMLESLASGHPVIASQASNAAGVIQSETNGWVFPTGDVETLAEILRNALLLSDGELRMMSIVCQQSVREYAVEAMVRSYEALYASLSSARS